MTHQYMDMDWDDNKEKDLLLVNMCIAPAHLRAENKKDDASVMEIA